MQVVYLRGPAEDYNRWAKIVGDDSWTWKSTKETFKEVKLSVTTWKSLWLTQIENTRLKPITVTRQSHTQSMLIQIQKIMACAGMCSVHDKRQRDYEY
jgi:choline dehydrogenase-like flavoprotein